MSFDVDLQMNESQTARERLQRARAKDISEHMQKALDAATEALKKSQEAMVKTANRKRKDMTYEPGDMVFLSSKNIKTTRPSKKLDDKILGLFKVLEKIGTSYRLELPKIITIHNVFHPSLLRKAADDPMPGQKNDLPEPIVVDNKNEWEVEDILDSRLYGRGKRLQYRVK